MRTADVIVCLRVAGCVRKHSHRCAAPTSAVTGTGTPAGTVSLANPNNTIPGSVRASNFLVYTDGATNPPIPEGGHVAPASDPTLKELVQLRSGDAATYALRSASNGTYGVTYYISGAPPTPQQLELFFVTAGDCATGTAVGRYTNDTFSGTGDYGKFAPFAGGNATLVAGAQNATLCLSSAGYMIIDHIAFTKLA